MREKSFTSGHLKDKPLILIQTKQSREAMGKGMKERKSLNKIGKILLDWKQKQ